MFPVFAQLELVLMSGVPLVVRILGGYNGNKRKNCEIKESGAVFYGPLLSELTLWEQMWFPLRGMGQTLPNTSSSSLMSSSDVLGQWFANWG